VSEAPPEVVDELYAAPPDEFVARRDARAKELRKSDRAAADAVKKLRKPSVSAAAVNRLAREARDDVEALLGAGEALRQAQFGGGDRDAIQAAARDEREAVERLMGQVGKLSPAVLEEVRETLRAAATDDEARAAIARGILTEARRPTGLGGFAVAPPADRDRARTSAKPGSTGRKTGRKKSESDAARKSDAERKRAAAKRVKAARTALRDAEGDAKKADRAVAAAERERDIAQRAFEKAERTLEQTRDDAEAAHAEVERRAAEVQDAQDA
jgi:hypothetical protein